MSTKIHLNLSVRGRRDWTPGLGGGSAVCDDSKLRLKAYLALATNCWGFCRTCDDAKKRLCCQAFFTKITITETHDIQTEFTGSYDTIMQPELRLHADYWQRNKQLHPAIMEEDTTKPDAMHGLVVRISEPWWETLQHSRN